MTTDDQERIASLLGERDKLIGQRERYAQDLAELLGVARKAGRQRPPVIRRAFPVGLALLLALASPALAAADSTTLFNQDVWVEGHGPGDQRGSLNDCMTLPDASGALHVVGQALEHEQQEAEDQPEEHDPDVGAVERAERARRIDAGCNVVRLGPLRGKLGVRQSE
jgi:hypothetical protein